MSAKEKMLLVDGDDGIRKALSLFFSSRNYFLHTAENAYQALLATEQEIYDIIICEQLLPDMNGLSLFEILNKRQFKGIKILITLYGNSPSLQDIHEKGIDSLLTKPFSGDEIEDTINRVISTKCLKNSVGGTFI